MATLNRPLLANASQSMMIGFTLIEVMMTITILGILLTIALPAFYNFIIDQRLKNASFELNSSLQYARSEAVKRMQSVSIRPVGGNWANGYSITYPDDSDADSNDEVLKNVGAQEGIAITGPTIVTFKGNGRTSAGGNSSFELSPSPMRSGVSSRCVDLDASGLPNNSIKEGTSC